MPSANSSVNLPARVGVVVLSAFAVLMAFITAVGAIGAFDKTTGGQIAVVRNGGPLDDNKIRQVINPASSRTWTGLWSHSHKYPAQQRFYTITSDAHRGDRPGVDVVHTPTSDGVDVGIEGTVYFSLNQDHSVLRLFDDKFGTRKFVGVDGNARFPYDGDNGWLGFLDSVIRPVIDNDLREQINNFRCAELVSSCALVQNSANAAANALGGRSNNGNIAKVQTAINSSLSDDLAETLGGRFLTDIRFNLVRVTLPEQVQQAVDSAQAAFAKVTEAQARVAQAKAEAQANEQRQRGYQQCPACAVIDELKAIPPSVTTFAPGTGFAITSK